MVMCAVMFLFSLALSHLMRGPKHISSLAIAELEDT